MYNIHGDVCVRVRMRVRACVWRVIGRRDSSNIQYQCVLVSYSPLPKLSHIK